MLRTHLVTCKLPSGVVGVTGPGGLLAALGVRRSDDGLLSSLGHSTTPTARGREVGILAGLRFLPSDQTSLGGAFADGRGQSSPSVERTRLRHLSSDVFSAADQGLGELGVDLGADALDHVLDVRPDVDLITVGLAFGDHGGECGIVGLLLSEGGSREGFTAKQEKDHGDDGQSESHLGSISD